MVNCVCLGHKSRAHYLFCYLVIGPATFRFGSVCVLGFNTAFICVLLCLKCYSSMRCFVHWTFIDTEDIRLSKSTILCFRFNHMQTFKQQYSGADGDVNIVHYFKLITHTRYWHLRDRSSCVLSKLNLNFLGFLLLENIVIAKFGGLLYFLVIKVLWCQL